ncbi:NAD-dependent epimerase/dehydratase family protein [Methanobacterium spitsbergense]|uniref:NAD-dependent epimerase/dehydratase family protein n=1 Tax=Methanobacterium spitsbergense TaxID=2874285 RepID=A0A8T5UVA7_9EURY|nr:NAD-dependent epimerase/dehydratase family protein [Methanobacterium spitsbergense]
MEKILVTGAGGFIGSHLAKQLYEDDYDVRVVDIKWEGYTSEPYYTEKLTLDLRVAENCRKATEGMDHVFHLAANMGGIGFITEVGAEIMHDSVLMNTNMLQASLNNNIERFFFSSSACIYPTYLQEDSDNPGLKEEDAYPADPDDFYGWEKLYTEKMCEAYQRDYDLEVRVARFHNIYGPEGTYDGGREKSPAALCRKVAQTSNPGTIEIWGDGEQSRSYCYIDDCIEGILRLMKSDFNQPLNIGSDRLITINEIADLIIDISGKDIEKKYDLSAPQGVRGRNADLTLIKKILGWEPQIPLEKGFNETYNWINEQVNK